MRSRRTTPSDRSRTALGREKLGETGGEPIAVALSCPAAHPELPPELADGRRIVGGLVVRHREGLGDRLQ